MKFLKDHSFFIILLAVCICFASYQLNKLASDDEYVEILIADGDTLWGLASEYADQTPINTWIQQVKQLNELPTDIIRSGETLKLPIKNNSERGLQLTQLVDEAE